MSGVMKRSQVFTSISLAKYFVMLFQIENTTIVVYNFEYADHESGSMCAVRYFILGTNITETVTTFNTIHPYDCWITLGIFLLALCCSLTKSPTNEELRPWLAMTAGPLSYAERLAFADHDRVLIVQYKFKCYFLTILDGLDTGAHKTERKI